MHFIIPTENVINHASIQLFLVSGLHNKISFSLTNKVLCQTGKDKYYVILFKCGILKNIKNESVYSRFTDRENKLMVIKGEAGRDSSMGLTDTNHYT